MTSPEGRLAAALSDRYQIQRELGHGGMATVYLAHDLKHNRPVAIKVLRPELSAVLGAARFAREIRITGQLSHPNILPVLDSGEDPAIGLCWYAMPYVEGESLRDLMKRETQLPIDDALRLFGEIAEALDYAHRNGFVHRDLKPENILLQDGHARVADFGIARSMSAVEGDKLTETGLALGTVQYMSPEQAAGQRNIDARSDIYALGCLLYEMLAGNPPFQGPTTMAIMARHAVDPVPGLRTVRATVPLQVEAAITKALAKVPADRFTSAAQFVEAFSRPVAAVPPASTKRLSAAWIAGIVVALAGAAGGVLFARSHQSQVIPSASVIAVLPFGTNGDTALTRLSHDLVFAISRNLDGVGGIRTADAQMVLSRAEEGRSGQYLPNALALGKQLGAGSVVMGSILQQGPTVQIDLKLMPTMGDSEPVARASVTGSPDSIIALTDSISWALLRQVWRRGEPPSPSYRNITTQSLQSLRAFLDGERLSVAGRWSEAADAYAAAVNADSSFWLAGWGFNNTQAWLEGTEDMGLRRKYEAHLSAFGERDRMLIEAEMTEDSAVTPWEHFDRFRRVAEKFPTDWSAGFHYADHLVHGGPLVGHTNAEIRAALQRVVDLNPKLLSMWEHLARASLGSDSAQAAAAVKSMTALGAFRGAGEPGFDRSLFYRVLVSAGGRLSIVLLDSLAAGIAGTPRQLGGSAFLFGNGFPAAQLEMNRRLLVLDKAGRYAGSTWRGMAHAWAQRGAWDSALVAWDRHAAASPDDASGLDIYQLAVSGAWLGALDTSTANGRRALAVGYLAAQPPDSASTKRGKAILAWGDGMLAFLRQDRHGVAAARLAVQQSGAEDARFLDRSLAGFELDLAGARRAAADSLWALELAASVRENDAPRDPYARSINHLAAARWQLEQGDTTRATRLLTWHEAIVPDRWAFQVFAPFAYYELAGIEEAQGRNDLASDHYLHFLRRYDRPPPAHQHLVDKANAVLQRLAGQKDAAT